VDNLPEGIDSKFRYVILISKRAEQLIQNPTPKFRLKNRKATRVALAEVNEGSVKWQLEPPALETDILALEPAEE
jgi:DNA-directed RNA polymerase subunit K/omega